MPGHLSPLAAMKAMTSSTWRIIANRWRILCCCFLSSIRDSLPKSRNPNVSKLSQFWILEWAAWVSIPAGTLGSKESFRWLISVGLVEESLCFR